MSSDTSPLLELVNEINKFLPRSLGHLCAFIQGSSGYPYFVSLIRDYLPESETEILVQPTIAEQVAKFAELFGEQYFPLSDWLTTLEVESYDDLLTSIPLEVRGLDDQFYHDLPSDGRVGLLIMTALVEPPYMNEGARIPIIEKCLDYVPKEMLEKIPENGFTVADLDSALIGTPYEALVLWSRMIDHGTDNFFIDTDVEELSMSYGHGYSGVPQWDIETVNFLSTQHHQANEIWDKTLALCRMIEEKPKDVLWEILNILTEDMYPVNKTQKETLFDLLESENDEEGGELCPV